MLLLIFLFNVGGYYIVFWALRFQTEKELVNRLDANRYHEEETIEIRIPLSLPYPIHAQNFERVNGEFEHNGEHFRLVKHKYENDTLFVICIRDRETRQLVNTMNGYVKLTQGVDGSGQNQKALNFLNQLVKDFYSQERIYILPQYSFTMRALFREYTLSFGQPDITVQAPPPRV